MQRRTQYRFASLRAARRQVSLAAPTWTELTASPKVARAPSESREWAEPLSERLGRFRNELASSLGLSQVDSACLSELTRGLAVAAGLSDFHLITLPTPADLDYQCGDTIKACLIVRPFVGYQRQFVRTRDGDLYELDADPAALAEALAQDSRLALSGRRPTSLAAMARFIPRKSNQLDRQFTNIALGAMSAVVAEVGGCIPEVVQLFERLVLKPVTDIGQAAIQRLAGCESPCLPQMLAAERLTHAKDHIAFASCQSHSDVATRKQAFRTYPALRVFARRGPYERERSGGIFRWEEVPIREEVERRAALRAIDARVPFVKELSRLWDCPKWAVRFALTIGASNEAGYLDFVAWRASKLSPDRLPKSPKEVRQFHKVSHSALHVHAPSLVAREILANGTSRLLRVIDNEQVDQELTDYFVWLLDVEQFLIKHKGNETGTSHRCGTLGALDKADSLPSLLELCKRWHQAQVQIAERNDQAVEPYQDVPRTDTEKPHDWPALFPNVVRIDQFDFRVLTTHEQLRAEGAAMQHCVGGYGGSCTLGSSNIVSVTRKGERVATAEIHVSRPEKSGYVAATLHQASGFRNAVPEASIKAALMKLVAVMCTGEIAVDDRRIPPSTKPAYGLDQLERDVLRLGERVTDVYAPALAFKRAPDEYPSLFRRAVRNLLEKADST